MYLRPYWGGERWRWEEQEVEACALVWCGGRCIGGFWYVIASLGGLDMG
jgi:hypothetical protein